MARCWAVACVLVAAMALGACGGGSPAKIEKVGDLKGKVVGSVTPPGTQKALEESVEKIIGAKQKEVQYFNRMSDCIMALQAGKVDAVLSPRFGADYFVKRNPALKIVASQPVTVSVVMALRSEDTQLKDDLDKAIATLQENGKLKSLEDEWVTNLPAANEPANKSADPIPGAKTVYVGVCGDYAPLDYIAANGRPAGFNVALLNELGQLLKVNFEFVSLESQARFTALSAKKIDLIFCNLDAKTPALMALQSKGWVATKPYFTSEVGCFLVRK